MFTLRNALPAYLESAPDIAAKTRRKLRYLIAAWERATTNPDITLIDGATFNSFRAVRLEEKRSPYTIEGAITDVLTILAASGFHPPAGRRLNLPEPDPTMPTLSDFGKVYAAAATAVIPQRRGVNPAEYMQAFFAFALWTGMRLDDLFTVCGSDVTNDVIRRRAQKTRKMHEYPNCEILRRHLAPFAGVSGPLFPHWRSSPTRLRDAIRDLCEAAGVAYFTPQEIRRLSINLWTDASPPAGAIIHGEALARRRSVLPFYLARAKPRQVLERAAPQFQWPDELLLPEDRDTRDTHILRLVDVLKRLPVARIPDVQRVAMAFAERPDLDCQP